MTPDLDTPDAPRRAPRTAWSVVTDAPLRGLRLAREAQLLLAWDESHHLWLVDGQGQKRDDTLLRDRLLNATISDDASLIVLLVEGPRLIFLDGELKPIADRQAPSESRTLAVDAHGRYAAVATSQSRNALFTRFGRPAGEFQTLQPLAFLRFIPSLPILVGASGYGTLFSFWLEPSGSSDALSIDERWRSQMMSNVGRLETSGDGGMILASCFTHGIQRYDARGRSEGSYHPGGTVTHAVPDFTGRTIGVATTEGDLFILNRSGNVRWRTSVATPIQALELDALGRYVIHGLENGQITRIDLDPSAAQAAQSSPAPVALARGAVFRSPAWSVPVATSDLQAETAVVAVLDHPPRVAVMTSSNAMSLFTTAGGHLGSAPAIVGVGRTLRTSPGWIAAATDRQIVLYDAQRNGAQRLDLSLVELTHLVIDPGGYGLAVVEERDRVARFTGAGRVIWKHELRHAVEEIAIGADQLTAVSSDSGILTIYGPAGEEVAQFRSQPPEPLLLASAFTTPPDDLAWFTLARRSQILRGHRADLTVIWETPVPWEAWRLHAVGPFAVAEAPDGRAMAFDSSGHPAGQNRDESDNGSFFLGETGKVCRLTHQAGYLTCAELDGSTLWRAMVDESVGPRAASRHGAAVLIGRSLAWFPHDPDRLPS